MAYVALGSNMGDSREILRNAISKLARLSDFLLEVGGLWRTTPVNCPPGSPTFWNTVVGFLPLPGESPESLIHKLQEMEKEAGREPKKIENEPRPLDLDLLSFGNQIRQDPHLVIPHPRAHQRKFVLQPLSEIAPNLVLPGQSRSVLQLLNDLRTEEALHRVNFQASFLCILFAQFGF